MLLRPYRDNARKGGDHEPNLRGGISQQQE